MLTDEDGQGPYTWPVGAQSSARKHKAHSLVPYRGSLWLGGCCEILPGLRSSSSLTVTKLWPLGHLTNLNPLRSSVCHLYMRNTLYIIIHPIACDPGLLSLSLQDKIHTVFHVPGAHNMMALASPIAHSILCSASTWSNTHPLVKGPL